MSRRGWDDRRTPEPQHRPRKLSENERHRTPEPGQHKRKASEDERHRATAAAAAAAGSSCSSSRWDEEAPSRHHRDSEAKRHRRYEEDEDEERQRRREDAAEDRQQRRTAAEERYREAEDRQQQQQQRDDDDRFRRGRSRFEQAFVRKEPSPEWGKSKVKDELKPKPDKEKPNLQTSGKLIKSTTIVNGVLMKYAEPPEARKPKRKWRLFPYKGEKSLPALHIDKQSAYLLGRDRKVVDIPLDHLSCSKQHAVLQHRLVPYKKPDGSEGKHVRPFLIDLESANGTFINKIQLEAGIYYELSEKNVIRFGASSREYVVLHESSKDEAEDDNVNET